MLLLESTRDTLLKPLQAVVGIVEKRHTQAILSNVLIERKGGVLSVLASDIDIQARATTEVAGDNFAITVSAKKLSDIYSSLPTGTTVKMELTDDNLRIKAGKSRFNLQTLPVADFPLTRRDPSGIANRVTVPQKLLKHLIELVQHAIAVDDARYTFNGMLLVLHEKTMTLVASDGHRLGLSTTEIENACVHQEIIIPRKTVNELCKQLSDLDAPVHIEAHTNQVTFSFGSVEIVSKLIDGKYPDYNRVIPTDRSNTFIAERAALLQSLQRAAILSNEKFRGVRLVLNDNEMRIACTNNDQEEALEELEIEYQGKPLDVGFNVAYLIDALSSMPGELVQCSVGDDGKLLVTLPEEPGYKFVVMPMRI